MQKENWLLQRFMTTGCIRKPFNIGDVIYDVKENNSADG
jgi:hypothetical protein